MSWYVDLWSPQTNDADGKTESRISFCFARSYKNPPKKFKEPVIDVIILGFLVGDTSSGQ